MNTFYPWMLVFIVGIGWGGWTLILRWSGLSSAWGTIIVMCAATLTLLSWNWPTLPAPPTGKQLACALIGGILLNGPGLIAYDKLITDPRFANSNLPAVSVVLFITLLAVGWILLGEQRLDLSKIAGIVLACGAAFFLTK